MAQPPTANPVAAAMVPASSAPTNRPAESSAVLGPLISENQLLCALQALDHCLQDYAWIPGENYLELDSLYGALHAKGITRAVIQKLLGQLIEQNIFRPYCPIIPAGYHIERGMRVFRSEEEATPCLITSRERWYGYLAETTRAARQPETSGWTDSSNPCRTPAFDLAAERSLTATEARAARKGEATEEEAKPEAASCGPRGAIPCPASRTAKDAYSAPSMPSSPSPTAEADLEFVEFSAKQQLLLRSLRGKDRQAILEVMRAVYGTTQTAISTLERLVSRTNKNLTDRGYRLEIKRKANKLSLKSV